MLSDLRFAFRSLVKSPGFTAVIVISLALGIGANATTLCWLRNMLFNPLPGVKNASELVVLVTNQGGGNASRDDLRDMGNLKQVFVGTEASQLSPASLMIDGQSEWVYGQVVTANFFDLLGVQAHLGRTFLPEEDSKPSGNPVLVISESYWRRRFHSDPSVIGTTVLLNRHPFTIIGVTPKPFGGSMSALSFDFWAPLSMNREITNQGGMENRGARMFHNLARLQPGVSVEQAQAAVNILNAQLAKAYPDSNKDASHRVVTLNKCPWGAQNILLPVLSLLLAVSFLVLLIVAANVANLLLARAVKRQKEIAIRLASGARRSQLIRLLLSESLLLSLVGGVGGIILATWMVRLLVAFLPSTDLPVEALNYNLDPLTLGVTLVLTIVTGLLIGLVPALQASRPQLYEVLKEGGRSGSAGPAHHRLRSLLVVSEVALSIVLLVCAGLCLKGFNQAKQIEYGFNAKGVLVGELHIGMNGYDEKRGIEFYNELQRRLAAVPGVEEAALSSWFPLGFGGCKGTNAKPDGYIAPQSENLSYEYARISPHYFAAMKIPLLAGRDFTEQDDSNATRVAIVNEAMAARFWPGQDPIGRTFRSGGGYRTVVGLAKQGKYYRLNEVPRPFFYVPYRQSVPDLDLSICLRVRGNPTSYAKVAMDTVHQLDAGVDLRGVMTLTDLTLAALFADRIASSMLAMMGGVALALAAMGIYAVMAYAVSQRTQEFGIRMALGATQGSVIRLVIQQGLLLVLIGVAVGLALALVVTHLLSGFLYGVSPFDPLTFIGVPLVLAIIAVIACLLPAHRATRIDPIEALRAE